MRRWSCLFAGVLLLTILCGAWPVYADITPDPNLIFAPEPVIPPVALRKGWGGKGIYRLKINPRNGTVDEVKVLKRTGYQVLDAEMVMTLFKWRFKPNTFTSYTLSYEIGILGRARTYHTGRY